MKELLKFASTKSGEVCVGVGMVIVLIIATGMYKMDKWHVDSSAIRD